MQLVYVVDAAVYPSCVHTQLYNVHDKITSVVTAHQVCPAQGCTQARTFAC